MVFSLTVSISQAAETYLISYPRSGINWTLYQLVNITHKDCAGAGWYRWWENGKMNLCVAHHSTRDENRPLLLYHSGTADGAKKLIAQTTNEKPRIILLLRNYRECMARNLFYNVPVILDRIKGKASPKITELDCGDAYFDNLYYYHDFDGEKLLVYYEDMIAYPQETLRKLIDFLGDDGVYFDDFFRNYETHFKESISKYRNNGGSYSDGDKPLYHTTKLGASVSQEIDRAVEEYHPTLWVKYLSGYALE